MDTSGDQLTIYFNSTPGTLTYYLGGNSLSGAYVFRVEESVDGSSYSILRAFSGTGIAAAPGGMFTDSPAASTRYIRFRYVTKVSGNVGIDGVSLTAGVSAPSVSTVAASASNTTTATLNGDVTADGGASVTERGVCYKTTAGVTIADNKTTSGSGTGAFSVNLSSLSVNQQYYFKAYAINSVNTTLGSELSFTTLANVPSAPTVGNPTSSSLDVAIGAGDGNPSGTEYAIQETGGGNYVQAGGSLGASPAYQTAATWGTKTVTGLSPSTLYTFQVRARNGEGVATAFGSTANGTTAAATMPTISVVGGPLSFGNVEQNATSAAQSFTVEGVNLTHDITVTPPAGFQISTTSGSGYGASPLVLSQSGGAVGTTTIYVKFMPTAVQSYNGSTLACTSTGATEQDVTLNGAGVYSAVSDITADGSFSTPGNIAYGSHQETDLTASSLAVAQFILRDGGGAADSDSAGTTLNSISFTVANSAGLRRVALYDGSTELGEVAAGTTVTFGSLSATAEDGGSKTLTLRVSFVSTVTDNQQFSFTVNSATAAAAGSGFAAANAGAAASSTAGDHNRIEVTATKLVFSAAPPASVNVGQNFSATVQARDANENVDLDSTASVTLSKASGSGTLTGGGAQNLASGAQTWPSLQIDAGGSFTIEATGGGLTPATSGSITATAVVAPGDVAIVRVNSSTDGFTVLALRDLTAGQVLYWTDEGWLSSDAFRSGGESAGTTDIITSDVSAGSTFDVSAGTALSTSGDQLFLFRGTKASPTLVYGADWDNTAGWDAEASDSNTSADPAATAGHPLSDEHTVSLGNNSGYKYTGTKTGTAAALLAAIANSANWSTTSDTSWNDGNFTLVTLAAEPSTQAANLSFGSVASTTMNVSWTSGNGANRLVVCRQGSAPSSGPVDGTTYTADANFAGSGSALGGGKVVYAGSGSSFSLSGLTASTTYYLQVYEYNGSDATANFLTTSASGNPASQATTAPENAAESDIVRASGFSEPANVAYASYQATDITAGNSAELARFTIRDGGASADADASATTLDAIGFTVANGAALRRVALYDGSTEIAEVNGGAAISFSGLGGLAAADGGTKDFSVRATFVAAVTDNQQLQFTVSSATAGGGGSTFAAANAGGAASDTTGDANRIEVTATKLVFTSVPSTVTVGNNFTASVAARDANDNLDLDSTASVTIGTASGAGTLTGGAAQNLAAGAQTWSALQIDTAGAFTIEVTGGGLTAAVSGSITASTLLGPGDAAFVGFNADASDDFALVFFKDVDAHTVLRFNDNEWSGSAFTAGEGNCSWDSGASTLPAGTVVTFNNVSVSGSRTVSAGSLSGGTLSIGVSEEGVFCFRGTDASTPTAFIAAIGNDALGTSFNSLSGTGLTDGDTAIRLTATADVAQYKGPRSGYTAAGYRALLNNMSNWDIQDGSGDQSADATAPDLPFNTTAFTLVTPASEPTVQSGGIAFNNVLSTSMDVSWTSGNGASRLVICRQGAAPSAAPVDGTPHTADADFTGAGDALGGGVVVYAGSGNSVTITDLLPSTTYYVQVFEFNGTVGAVNYLTSTASGNPAAQATAVSTTAAQSDIVRSGGFTEPANLAYASYQATDVTDANSIELARFTVRDGGAGVDADAAATTLESITFSVANSAVLRRIALYDGTTEMGEVAAGATATFSGLSVVAADGATKELSIRATFLATVTDNQQVQFTVTAAGANAGGSTFAAADAGGAASAVSGDANRIEVTASKLTLTSVPVSVTVGQSFSVSVEARDANNNVDLDSTASVTITKASGGGVLSGGGAQSLVAGAGTWASMQIDTAGTFTLQAAASGLTTAGSGNIAAAGVGAALFPGDVAIIGRTTDTSPDTFAILLLTNMQPGQILYFTDNGWQTAGGYRSASSTDGDGNENLTKLTFNAAVPAGTIIRAYTGAAAYTWTTSGAIPGSSIGSYATLSLGQSGEQIYVFTAGSENPLHNIVTNLFVLDDTDGFENATDGSTGDAPPGLSPAANTAVTLPLAGTFAALDMQKAGSNTLTTKAGWLDFINDANNWVWSGSGTLPSGTLGFDLACGGGLAPVIVVPATTVTAGNTANFSFVAHDPTCIAPQLTATGLPAGATFSATIAGTNRVGTFTWATTAGDHGAHPIVLSSSDGTLTTSRVVLVYVGKSGEGSNGSGVPLSLTNWAVSIENLYRGSSGNATLVWDTVEGVPYDVYATPGTPGASGIAWTKVGGSTATSSAMSLVVGGISSQMFYQVTPAGTPPSLNGIWGVVLPSIVPGVNFFSVPLLGDRRLDGELGGTLASVLAGNNNGIGSGADELHLMDAAGQWVSFFLDESGAWREGVGGAPATNQLAAGQGVMIMRFGGAAVNPYFSGAVGNSGSSTGTVYEGWNIVGLSEGKALSMATAFESTVAGSPYGSYDETASDLYVIYDTATGKWIRMLRLGAGTWLDLSTGGVATRSILPGKAGYYYRTPGQGGLNVRF